MKYLSLFILILFPFFTSHAQRQDTPDNWRCSDGIGGTWVFGTAPRACAVKDFISDRFVETKFKAYIFDERKNRSDERIRYVSEFNNLILKAANYYLEKRKAGASQDEKQWWRRAVLAISHQESFMSHYRRGSDQKLRMMRGDFGHGHGLMQVDDRWHFAAVNNGRAANLIDNLFYALDIFYDSWQKAPAQSCVSSDRDWYNRVRAAYGGYNGGRLSMCRFTNPNHKFSRNDKNFKDKLDAQTWKRYISSSVDLSPIDIACLSNPTKDCSSPPHLNPDIENKKVLNYRNLLCALENNSYKCIEDKSLRFCLVDKFKLINEVINVSTQRPVTLLKKNEVCNIINPPKDDNQGLLKMGDFIELKKNINIRKTPGGQKLGLARNGEKYQILDVKSLSDKNYYQIKKGSQQGYIYAGTAKDQADWSIKASSAPVLLIPLKGEFVAIATRSGTNLRKTPGGQKIGRVPNKTELKVMERVFIKESGEIFIKVNYRGSVGFLYSGQINPKLTIQDWITVF